MFDLSVESAYLVFAVWTYLVYLSIRWELPDYKQQMRFMGFWGGVGGVLISQLYRRDFWNPPSILGYTDGPIYITIEDFLFGGAFLGIVTVLLSIFTGRRLEKDPLPSSRFQKWATVLFVVGVSLVGYQMGLNSVVATMIAFALGAVGISAFRVDLTRCLMGGLATFMAYVTLIGFFLVFVDNVDELARQICQFYVENGAIDTALVLSAWSFAFGAFFTQFYPFIKGQRYVDR